MSHQTRIDQFYKINGNKHSHVIKKHSRLKTMPYLKSRKKDINKKQNVSLSQHIESDDISDCTIIYEKSNEMHNSFLNDIKMIQYDDKIIKNNISLYENDHLEETSNINMQLQETLENKLNNDYMKTVFNSNNNSHLKKTPTKESNSANIKQRTPNKNNFSLQNTNSPIHKKLSYTPRISFGNKSPKIIEKKNLFDENINNSIIIQTIKNMNLVKQGGISLHNFDLEKIYSKNTFNYQYNDINTENLIKYELNNINLSNDLNSKILFITIFSVLSLPINCGYFDENDLNFIYSIITLPKNAQMLLARMIKRKRKWFRKSNISYPEIDTDLKDIFQILVSRSICTFDIQKENLSTILELLQVSEIQQLCKNMKINPKGNKKNNIQKLLKLSSNKPLFPGIKSPSNFLYASILDILDYCVCITTKTWNIIDRIITLLIPNQNAKYHSTSDIFYFLCDVYLRKIIFPNNTGYYFPVFSCKLHLTSYVEAKSILSTTLQYIEKKDWKKVQEYGNLAMDKLPNLLEIESLKLKNSILPIHVRRYMPGYIWLKILSKCIEAFKKNQNKKRVIEILSFLLKQNCHMLSYKGIWYEELALIEMHHHKNIEKSASIIIQALNTENLTQVDKVNLIDRANKIVKKKVIKSITKTTINEILNDYIPHVSKYEPISIIINATVMPRNTAGNKSIWCIENSIENQTYGSVETVAFHHYQKQGFPNGLHCEGALPNILFCTLFWEELYDIHIPGAFVTPYQEAPGDLYTDQFYKNRKEKIDMKLKIISDLSSELLSSRMKEKFVIFKQYQSAMITNLDNNLQLEEIVHCLGVQGVIGICKRLIENFKLWRAGFPDLIVWNYDTKEHKIIEVKGPRDILSTKQKLWLEYLHQLGLNIEVCLVQDKC